MAGTVVPEQQSPRRGMEVGGSIGGMDENAVRRIAVAALPDAQACVEEGRRRVASLGGDVELKLRVNRSGRVVDAELLHSTLGAHDVERCVVQSFAKRRWPRPVGGAIGEIEQSFGFEPGEQPRMWDADALAAKMRAEAQPGDTPYQELTRKLHDCRRSAQAESLDVTLYLDEEGTPQAVGSSADEATAECVDTIVQTTSFPAPVAGYAKVTVNLR